MEGQHEVSRTLVNLDLAAYAPARLSLVFIGSSGRTSLKQYGLNQYE